jgi:glycosyltransferase involved in cell wall biosynthesis
MNLAICLKSKLYTNWECIIVNDGSPDDTESVAQKWCTRITDLSISQKNGGLSSTRNAGITISKRRIYFTFGRR